MRELLRLMGMLGVTLSGFRLYVEDWVGGAIQGAGTALAGYWAAQQAKEDRKQRKNIFNKESQLSIAQANNDKLRLAGLAGVFSGDASRNYAGTSAQYGLGGAAEDFDAAAFGTMLQAKATASNNDTSADSVNYNKWVELNDSSVGAGTLQNYAAGLANNSAKTNATANYANKDIYTYDNADDYKI